MNRLQSWLMAALLAGLVVSLPLAAVAHEMTMAELDVRELSKGEFIWRWGPGASRPVEQDLTAIWPDGCQVNEQSLRCAQGLIGRMSVAGVGKTYSAAMVRIAWLDGRTRVYAITPAQPAVQLHGGADDSRGWQEILVAYTALGIEHILGGIDHLLFVIGLLFLVGFNRRLLGTITAFTLAHSLTLASSALGWLSLRSAPVEACIALSIMLVASEALRERPTLARSWPALVAFIFGLVHGLGFAGALQEIGLPEHHLLVALLTFNLGVEIGQLLTVGLAWALVRWAGRYRWADRARQPALYAIGTMAAYWSWLRLAAVLA
jgi:HupE / UreJ protein